MTALAETFAAATPVLETPRLILRAPRLADFDGFAAYQASDRARFTGGPVDGLHGAPVLAAGTLPVVAAGTESAVPAAVGRRAGDQLVTELAQHEQHIAFFLRALGE